MVGAVEAAVDAVVREVEGREHDDAVAIEVPLDLPCQLVDLMVFVLQGAGQEHRGFPVGEAFFQAGFGDNLVDEGGVNSSAFLDLGLYKGILPFWDMIQNDAGAGELRFRLGAAVDGVRCTWEPFGRAMRAPTRGVIYAGRRRGRWRW